MEENTNKRGGARPGAGRKKIDGRIYAITFRLSNLAKKNLENYARENGLSQQGAINKILEAIN